MKMACENKFVAGESKTLQRFCWTEKRQCEIL
jgi:hypothetical protein